MVLSSLVVALVISQAPAASPARSGVPAAPGGPEEAFTAWSCTVATLISGKECVFESEARPATDLPAQEKQNVKLARELAPAICAQASRVRPGEKGDPALDALCRRDFEAAAEHCGLDGKLPLVDAKGRFTPAARGCYLALATSLQKLTMHAALSASCCQCLATQRCGTAGPRCYDELAQNTPSPSSRACMKAACAEACGNSSALELTGPSTPTRLTASDRSNSHDL